MRNFHLIVVVALTLAKPALAQQDFSKVEIKTIPVAKNIYMLEGSGGNIGVSAGADGILIVDDQFAPLAPKIEAALHQLNPGKLKFVLNTHFHGDHTGGNAHFGRESHIIAQENARNRLAGICLHAPSGGGKLGIDATKKIPGDGFERAWPPLILMSGDVQQNVDPPFGRRR